LKRVIIMPLFGIGDALMCTPALRNLKEKTGAHITFLHMFRTTHDVILHNPYVDELLYYPFLDSSRISGVRYLLSLRGGFDASINFYPSNRRDYNLASFLVGAPLRIGHRYREGDLSGLNFLNNRTLMEDDGLHNVEENLRLLSFLGVDRPEPYPMEIHLSPQERSAAGKWLSDHGIGQDATLVGLHAGSSVFKDHTNKRWPAEKFAGLMRELARKRKDVVFLLFGGPEEKPLKDHVIGLSGLPEGKALTVETPGIRPTAAVMGSCSAMLSNDSGLMHLAASLRVPTAVIFGPTNPLWLRPWSVSSRVLNSGDCEPCFRYSPVPVNCSRGGFPCIQDIEVGDALEAIEELLDSGKG